jgi:GntR family transcriptional regulator
LERGAPLLSITKLWLADGRPAIWCRDSVPLNLILNPYSEDLLREDIFTFLQAACNQAVSYQIADLFARRLGEELAETMNSDEDVPVVASNACGYNPDGVPVLYDTEVYAPGIMVPTVIRAKI